jgi:hypothetical protein
MRAHIHDGLEHITLLSEARIRPALSEARGLACPRCRATIAAFASALASRLSLSASPRNGELKCHVS